MAGLKTWGNLKKHKNLSQPVFNYDQYLLSKKEWVFSIGVGILLCAIISYVFYRSMIVFFIICPFGCYFPIIRREQLKKKRLQRLKLEFKEGIQILSSFLSAGYSIENAFGASVKELNLLYGAEGLITREFCYIYQQIRMNQSIEGLLMDFASRSGLDEVKNFGEVFCVAKRSGGELVAIISHTTGIIRDKIQIYEEIMTMTASKRYEQRIMNVIPILIVLYIDFSSPGFFEQMYTTWFGKGVMSLCLVIYVVALVLSEQIMKIEV